jgi:hypothetical protein
MLYARNDAPNKGPVTQQHRDGPAGLGEIRRVDDAKHAILRYGAIRSRATCGPGGFVDTSHVSSYRSRLLPVRSCQWHADGMEDLDIQCLRRSALIAQGIKHRFPNTIHTDRPILPEAAPRPALSPRHNQLAVDRSNAGGPPFYPL